MHIVKGCGRNPDLEKIDKDAIEKQLKKHIADNPESGCRLKDLSVNEMTWARFDGKEYIIAAAEATIWLNGSDVIERIMSAVEIECIS